MKRKKIKGDEIDKHYSFFRWVTCEKCEMEFVRESGWSFISGPFSLNGKYMGRNGIKRFVCKECAPTIEEIRKYPKGCSWIPPKPHNWN